MRFQGLLVVLVLIGGALYGVSYAQQSTGSHELLLTWDAQTYTPTSYRGKALPIPGATITTALQLLSSERPRSLKTELVRWYVNDELYQSGVGLTRISLTLPTDADGILTVRADVPGLPGISTQTIGIPIAQPRVVIPVPYRDATSYGPALLRAQPYFFTTPSLLGLTFAWTLNGAATPIEEDPSVLRITPTGTGTARAAVAVSVRNTRVRTQVANATTALTLTTTP